MKKGLPAIAELLAQMKLADSEKAVRELAAKAEAFVQFALMDEKKSRISNAQGDELYA